MAFPLVRFSLAAGLAYTAYAMCRVPVLPLYARHLGAGPELIGLVAGASTITGVLLKLPVGTLSDTLGRRAVLVTAAAVFALAPLAYPWTLGVAALIALRFAHGSATALFSPTAYAALSDVAPDAARGQWLGTYAAIQGAGQAAGPVLAGWLLQRKGFTPTFLSAAVVGITAWGLVVSIPIRSARSALQLASFRASVAAVAADHRLVITSVAQGSQFALHGMITAFLPLYAVERVGLSATEAGVLFGAQMATTILSRPVFGRVSDRAGRRPMIVAGLSTCAAAVALFATATTFASLLLWAAVYGAGLAVTTSSTAALVTDLSDRTRYGAAHGLFGTIFDIGDASGPLVGGVIAGRFGYHTLFYSFAAIAAALAALFAISSRHWQTRRSSDAASAARGAHTAR